jgi:DNA-binding transcriptional ArsR family regulator
MFVYFTKFMEITKLSQIFKTLGNERRLKIIDLCQEPQNVTQISKKLKIPLTRTSEYLSDLQRLNLILKKRNEDNTVTITSLIEINDDGEIRRKN